MLYVLFRVEAALRVPMRHWALMLKRSSDSSLAVNCIMGERGACLCSQSPPPPGQCRPPGSSATHAAGEEFPSHLGLLDREEGEGRRAVRLHLVPGILHELKAFERGIEAEYR